MARRKRSASARRQPPKPVAKRAKEILAKQRKQRGENQRRKKAESARDKYKVRKQDLGKIVMIGTKGQRNPQAKGRKGYLVYVTKSGKKWILKTRKNGGYKPTSFSDIEAKMEGKLKEKKKEFRAAKLKQITEGNVAKISASVKSSGPWDFNDKMVDKMAKDLKRGIESQRSHRRFVIDALVLIKLPDGTEQTIPVAVDIAKPDHVAIRLGGIRNFISKKFYAFMAQQLAMYGYVSSGSANHIRRLEENADAEEGEYLDNRGEDWAGNDAQVVRIQRIDWKLLQAS